MDTEDLDLHRSTLRALTRLMSQWSSLELQRQITADCGVSLDPVSVRALYGLGTAGGTSSPSALADELHLTRPSTSKLIARLVDAGLVDRHPDESDGRSVQLELTEEGRRTFETLFDAGVDMLVTTTAGWDRADLRALATLLTRFTGGTTTDRPTP
ncbi:MarR family winged helix-turn-helix transcriptional regulator [Citricoccus sp. K5]|uniref:MarR family winged helix-turn-helix transcriptional regulator n=1 Tax=Citricoccus sp. K5 TaxID=2653135 RepID=UPI00135BA16F|nr:MarR family transcriptional regulator [Citricoccus sp. K5]